MQYESSPLYNKLTTAQTCTVSGLLGSWPLPPCACCTETSTHVFEISACAMACRGYGCSGCPSCESDEEWCRAQLQPKAVKETRKRQRSESSEGPSTSSGAVEADLPREQLSLLSVKELKQHLTEVAARFTHHHVDTPTPTALLAEARTRLGQDFRAWRLLAPAELGLWEVTRG